jgi:hypothetical protein
MWTPGHAVPDRVRTVLPWPSQPTTNRYVVVSVPFVDRSVTRTGSGARAPPSSPVSSIPRSTGTPRSASARLSTVSTSIWRISGRWGERRVRQRESAEPDRHQPGAPVQACPGCGVRPSQQIVNHTQRAEDLQRPAVHDEGPGRPEGVRAPLHDPHPGTMLVRLQRQRQAGRAGTHHDGP